MKHDDELKQKYKHFNISFDYSEVAEFEKFDYVIFFNKKKASNQTEFIAEVFNTQGEPSFLIPFPEVKINHQALTLIYMWCWHVENGIKFVFNTSELVTDDFWYEFDFNTKTYTHHGKAY